MADNSDWEFFFVDDEEHHLVDYRRALRRSGCDVRSFTKIMDAFDAIKSAINRNSEKNIFVIIDIMLPGQDIPTGLLECYNKIENKYGINNEGQALGQWLWNENKFRGIGKKIYHCYFSNLPSHYLPPKKLEDFEFCLPEQGSAPKSIEAGLESIRKTYVLDKTKIRPTELLNEIIKISVEQDKCWACPCPALAPPLVK